MTGRTHPFFLARELAANSRPASFCPCYFRYVYHLSIGRFTLAVNNSKETAAAPDFSDRVESTFHSMDADYRHCSRRNSMSGTCNENCAS